eukprot:scaffold4830_cov219-Chaetoceros_neogracile.AAC.3
MVKGSSFSRFNIVAKEVLMECVPTSDAVKPSLVSEYSQERIAKKRAPPMDSGSEAWRFTGGSSIE